MRTDPTLVSGSGVTFYNIDRNNSSDGFDSLTLNLSYKTNAQLLNTTDVSGTAGQSGTCFTANNGGFVAFEAEL